MQCVFSFVVTNDPPDLVRVQASCARPQVHLDLSGLSWPDVVRRFRQFANETLDPQHRHIDDLKLTDKQLIDMGFTELSYTPKVGDQVWLKVGIAWTTPLLALHLHRGANLERPTDTTCRT
jgi:hypothetical protein